MIPFGTARFHDELWMSQSTIKFKCESFEPEFKAQAVSSALSSQLSQTQIDEELRIFRRLASGLARETSLEAGVRPY